jgi:RNA polymerase sigma-70 factor (sigma-E family)
VRALYERNHADMVRFAAFLTGNVDAAEDVAHEAFIRVFDAWDRIEDPARADAYLRTTVVNVVRSGYRRDEVAARRAERHLVAVPSAEDDALGQLGRQHVLTVISSLPLQQRACVVMRHWMRMTESEIAETLGVSVGSVRTHVKRGTAALKDRLGGTR